jgi:hypothetical protein
MDKNKEITIDHDVHNLGGILSSRFGKEILNTS